MLARRVGERASRIGPEGVTALVDDLLAGADLVCGNLEAPFCRASEVKGGLRADASSVVALRRLDVLNVANNHIGDCGDAGVDETLATLRDAGIRPIGVGHDDEEALAPTVVTANTLRVGFIGCATRSLLPRGGSSRHVFGELESPLLPRMISDGRAHVDALVVNVHAGNEHVAYPPPSLRARLLGLCRAGADVVVTHHPHVLGGYEQVERSLIWHSLGDFLFDGDTPARRRGGMLAVDFATGGLRDFALVPTHVSDDLRVAPAPARWRLRPWPTSSASAARSPRPATADGIRCATCARSSASRSTVYGRRTGGRDWGRPCARAQGSRASRPSTR